MIISSLVEVILMYVTFKHYVKFCARTSVNWMTGGEVKTIIAVLVGTQQCPCRVARVNTGMVYLYLFVYEAPMREGK